MKRLVDRLVSAQGLTYQRVWRSLAFSGVVFPDSAPARLATGCCAISPFSGHPAPESLDNHSISACSPYPLNPKTRPLQKGRPNVAVETMRGAHGLPINAGSFDLLGIFAGI